MLLPQTKRFFKKQKEFQNYSPSLIFYMIFEEKCFPCYILLTDQILMSGCLVRYWAIYLILFLINQEQYTIGGFEYILSPKNHARKFEKIHKDIWTISSLMYNFLWQNVQIFPNYILLTRRINKFWNQKFWTEQVFICLKMPWYTQILLTCTKSIFTCSANFYHFPTLSVKNGSFFFSHLLICTKPTILLDATPQALILCLDFF